MTVEAFKAVLSIFWAAAAVRANDKHWDKDRSSDDDYESPDNALYAKIETTTTVVAGLLPISPATASDLVLLGHTAENDRLKVEYFVFSVWFFSVLKYLKIVNVKYLLEYRKSRSISPSLLCRELKIHIYWHWETFLRKIIGIRRIRNFLSGCWNWI